MKSNTFGIHMQCVVLAGGLATRIRPLTENLPKSLVPILETPFLFYQLEWLEKHGVDKVLLSIAYQGQMIRDAVKNFLSDFKTKLEIDFVDEGDDLKGTAGALRLAFDENKLNEQFFVLYGDSFLPVSFEEIWKKFLNLKTDAMMTVFHNDGKFDKSNVAMNKDSIELYDKKNAAKKMSYIDYGLMAFDRKLIEKEVPSGRRMDLADLLNKLSIEKKLSGIEVSERFYEVGSFEGIRDFTRWCQQKG